MASIDDRFEQFRQTWESPPGLAGWLKAVNNQPLGKRFMVTAFSFFLIGGVMGLLIRIQLAVSDNNFLGPEVYNQLFTMHGSTMMYLFAVPFLEGLALYVLPLMLGSRDVAFPRLTAFSYWTYLFGGLVFYSSFLFGAAPAVGWFGYTPLSTSRFEGIGVDFWLLGLSLVEIAGITAAVEVVVTILKFRAPGMSINRLPLFAWAILVAGLMMLFAFTTLLMATVLLEFDRALSTRFFDTTRGGNSLLWQHLFWFFGHPEVYIIFIPATGIVSMVVATFAKRIAGYTLIAMAIIVTGFVSFGLWVHHMYTTGLPELSMHFFAAASLMIAVASGTQVFAWIASLWGSMPALKAPLMFIFGFVFIFVLGGMTGVMIAVVPFDWQVHDTFFIVAHFHYVLIGGAVFPILAGLHYWLPKITGRMMSESLGMWSFWLTFLGFNATFFPMHIMGFLGMPRRVYTYPSSLQLDGYNLLATAGAFVMALGFLLFVGNFFRSLRKGAEAGKSPWGGDTLEWSVDSPPPVYTFHTPPVVKSLHPLWQMPASAESDPALERVAGAMAAAPADWRATLVTDVVRARPQAIQWLPGPTITPLVAAAGTLVAAVGILAKQYLLAPLGGAVALGALIGWLWPKRDLLEKLLQSDVGRQAGLPLFTTGSRSTTWWGMVSFLAILATAFGVLFYAYFYIRLFSERWPQDDLPRPNLIVPALGYIALIAGAVSPVWTLRRFREGDRRKTHLGLGATLAAGLAFLASASFELSRLPFWPQTNAYGSLVYVVNWHMMALVLIAVGFSIAAHARLARDRDQEASVLAVQIDITALLWHFTGVVAALVFAVLHLTPYLL